MPSPFPGMDPYLEAPELFPDLHHGLISEIQAVLNGRLRPAYHSMVEERVYISDENDPGREAIIPDVAVIRPTNPGSQQIDADSVDADSDLAVAEPVIATTMIDEEIREASLVIYDAADRQVVTVIEVLSPTNKIVGARGRDSYETKRQQVFESPAHLVEIDLLRKGVPIYSGERIAEHDYLVHVSRRGDRPQGILWPILLKQRLPVIKIPLLPKDPDVDLDLGAVFATAYDRAGYDMVLDYSKPPRVPLEEPKAAWAKAWLAKRSG